MEEIRKGAMGLAGVAAGGDGGEEAGWVGRRSRVRCAGTMCRSGGTHAIKDDGAVFICFETLKKLIAKQTFVACAAIVIKFKISIVVPHNFCWLRRQYRHCKMTFHGSHEILFIMFVC